MNDARVTRIVALMTGNGVVLGGLWHHWVDNGYRFSAAAILAAVVALAGLSAAYSSLVWQKGRTPQTLEVVSVFSFAINVFLFALLNLFFSR
jgi:hypothetical protein